MFLRFPKKLNVHLVFYICLIIAIIGAHWIWFFSSATLTSGDWGFIHKGQGTDWLPFPSIWSTPNLGSLNVFFANSPVEWALRTLTDHLSYGVALRMVYLIPTVLLSVVSIHLLANELRFSIPAKIAAVSIYLCSTPMIATRTGHNTLAAAYAVAPMILVTFKKSIEKPISYSTLLTPILCALMSAYEPRAFYLLLFVLGLFAIRFFIVSHDLKRIIGGSLTILFIGIFYVLLSAYWLLPFSQLISSAGDGVLGRSLFRSDFASFLGFFTLHHPFWNGGKYESFVVHAIDPTFFLIPILVVFGLVIARRNTNIFPFVVILLLGLFLGKQDNPPFGSIYGALYMYFPGFNAFRESSKFFFYATLATAVIVGNLFNVIFSTKRHLYLSNQTIRFLGLVCLTCLVFINSLNLIPLATGEMGRMFVARQMPSDYQILNDYLSKVEGTYRIMGIPTLSRWVIKSDRIPIITLYDILDSDITNRFPQIREIREYSKKIAFLTHQEGFLEYLADSSVKYVIVPSRDIANDDDFYVYFENNRKIFTNSLDKTRLKKININMADVELYENPLFRDRITLREKGDAESVEGIFINASTFKFNLSGKIPSQITIDFREKYDQNWKIFQPNLLTSRGILSANSVPHVHLRSERNQNIFILDIEQLCNHNGLNCKYNNGRYTVEFLIAYEPQHNVMVGYIISGCSLAIMIVGSLVLFAYRYFFGRKIKNH